MKQLKLLFKELQPAPCSHVVVIQDSCAKFVKLWFRLKICVTYQNLVPPSTSTPLMWQHLCFTKIHSASRWFFSPLEACGIRWTMWITLWRYSKYTCGKNKILKKPMGTCRHTCVDVGRCRSRIRQPDFVAFVGQLSGHCKATNVSSWILSSWLLLIAFDWFQILKCTTIYWFLLTLH